MPEDTRLKVLLVAVVKAVSFAAVWCCLSLLIGCKTTQPLSHSTDSIVTEEFKAESVSVTQLTVTTGIVSATIDSSHTLTTWYDSLGRPVKTEDRRDWHHGAAAATQTTTKNDSTTTLTKTKNHTEVHDNQVYAERETWWQRLWRHTKTFGTAALIIAIMLALLNFDRIVAYIKSKYKRSIFD